ncbi:MAG: hypothetical protein DI623_12840 [Sphingomonas sanxanigenens]|uniref:Cell wall hydrolase n=1 Tax=Sphingomonas sanxanigenens TaxID=397260 RepID=A0A2W5A1D2_9SPHN|nr:MAG: hypothetical protein DI623_12840 [Sphingomonas sanxanigenens]
MPSRKALLTIVALLAAGPAMAQSTPSPEAQEALARANDPSKQPPSVTYSTDPASEASYQRDMAAYRALVTARKIAVASDAVRYARQQRAYADAMQAWRVQVDQCQRGDSKACKAPTPDPADFY